MPDAYGAPPASQSGGLDIPLSDEGFQSWKARLEAAKTLNDKVKPAKEKAVQAYLGKRLLSEPRDHTVVVPEEFSAVEQKAAQLCFKDPEIIALPKRPDFEQGAPMATAVVNHYLSPHHVDLEMLMRECLFDVLTTGIGVAKVGYAAATRMTQQPLMQDMPDPMTGQPMPVMDEMGQPVMQDIEEVICEEYFAKRVGFTRVRIPHEFLGGNYNDAPWLAVCMEVPDTKANRKAYGLPADWDGGSKTANLGEYCLTGEKDALSLETSTPCFTVTDLWYKASLYPDQGAETGEDATTGVGDVDDQSGDEDDPRIYRELMIVDGYDKPTKHRTSPYQQYSPQGKLIGMPGNPIKILTLRTVTDSAYPISDLEPILELSQELSIGRSQMIRHRDDARVLRGINTSLVDAETARKIEQGTVGTLIPFAGDPTGAMVVFPAPSFPQDNYAFNTTIKRDIDQTLALSSTQRGNTELTGRTATELNQVQQSADVRLDKERIAVMRFIREIAESVLGLLQLFADDEDYIEIIGPDNVKRLEPWNRQKIAGEFLLKVKPDSALRPDLQQDRQLAIQLYTQLGNDPNIARTELAKAVLQKFDVDPSKIIVQQLPPKPPEQPKLALSLKVEDLVMPGVGPIAISILQQYGIQLDPNLVAQGQQIAAQADLAKAMAETALKQADAPFPPAHPGATTPVQPISKHTLDRTGNPSGINAPMRGRRR